MIRLLNDLGNRTSNPIRDFCSDMILSSTSKLMLDGTGVDLVHCTYHAGEGMLYNHTNAISTTQNKRTTKMEESCALGLSG